VPLFKYDKLRRNLIETIINNFRTNTLSNIAKGKYVIRFSDEFLEKVNDDIEKINFEDFHIKDVIDLVDKNLEKTTAERETILGELEFEIKDLLAESEGKVNKEDIIDLLLNFTCYDFYDELYELWKNKTILEGEELYLYFYDIEFNDNRYPVFFLPITLVKKKIEIDQNHKDLLNDKISDIFDIEYGSQLLINKSALEFIARSVNDLLVEKRPPLDIPNRHLYLGDFDIPNEMQATLNEICSYFRLDSLKIKEIDSEKVKNEHIEISNNFYIAICDKSDESLLNDFEELKDLLTKGETSTLVEIFTKMNDSFLLENPKTFEISIEDEYSNKNLTEKLSYHSPVPLNQEQQKILMALRNPGVKNIIVEGPPGTGKSHTITAIIFNALLENKSVLMTSDKKEALDVVEDKITGTLDRIRKGEEFLQNPILRLGKKETNYSKIFNQQNYEKIRSRYFAGRRNLEPLDKDIEECSQAICKDIENQIDVYSSTDLRNIKEIISLENSIKAKWQDCIEFAEAHKSKEFADVISKIYDIIADFKNIKEIISLTKGRINYAQFSPYGHDKIKILETISYLITHVNNLSKLPLEIVKKYSRYLKPIEGIPCKDIEFPAFSYEILLRMHSEVEKIFVSYQGFLKTIYVDLDEIKNNISRYENVISELRNITNKLKNIIEFYQDNFLKKREKFILLKDITDQNIEEVDRYIKKIYSLKSKLFGIILKRDELEEENHEFLNKFPSGSIFKHPHRQIDLFSREYRFYKLILNTKCDLSKISNINLEHLNWASVENLLVEFNDFKIDKASEEIETSLSNFLRELKAIRNSNYFSMIPADLSLIYFQDYSDLYAITSYVNLARNIISFLDELKSKSGIAALDKIIDIYWFLEQKNIDDLHRILTLLQQLIAFYRDKDNLLKTLKDFYLNHVNSITKLGIDINDPGSLVSNKLCDFSKVDVKNLCDYLNKYQDILDTFNKLRISDFRNERMDLEDNLVLKMTHILDAAVVKFRSENQKDQQEIRDLIRKKKKIPKELLRKLVETFPCLIVNIRDLGEYLPLEPEIFDIVIIDEASQVSIAQAFPAILRGKKVVVFGDHRQYSNVKSATAHIETNNFFFDHVRKAYKKYIDNFPAEKQQVLVNSVENFNIKKSILDFLKRMANYSCSLRKHFRGYKEIIEYSNKHFYKHYLQIVKIRSKPIDSVLNFHILQNVDKADIHSNTNSYESDFIMQKLEELKENGSEQSVGIITPFTNQQRHIYSKALSHKDSDYFIEKLKLKVMTFDTCQGDEKDIIFYSFVERDNEDILKYIFPKDLQHLDDEEEGTIKAQRLNVGFSRTKEEMHFVLSKDINNISGEIGRALTFYFNELKETRRLPSLDECNEKERLVLSYITQTEFYEQNKSNIEIFAQFKVGEYLKQIYDVEIPNYRSDFLIVYNRDDYSVCNIVVEYDGFEFHFKNNEYADINNFDKFYIEQDIERQKTLESYGYSFIRLNKFVLRGDPIQYLDKYLMAICKKKLKSNSVITKVIEDAGKIRDGELKQCLKCGAFKDIKSFIDHSTKSGIGRYCNSCKYVESLAAHPGKKSDVLRFEKVTDIKKCTKCGILKNITEFRFRKTRNYYESTCKVCEHEEKRKYRKEKYAHYGLVKEEDGVSKRNLLEDAINHGETLNITYTNSYGKTTTRKIKPLSLAGGFLKAYCFLRGQDRTFRVSRIKNIN